MDTVAFIVAQFLGVMSAIIFISSVQFKDKRHIIYFLIASTIISMSALAALGAWGGFTTNFMTLIPTLFVYHLGKRHHKPHPQSAWAFIVLLFIAWLMVYSGPVDFLALIGSSVYIFSLFQRHENSIRGLLVVNQMAWISYNFSVNLYSAGVFGIFFIISDLIAIVRFHKHGHAHKAVHHWWR